MKKILKNNCDHNNIRVLEMNAFKKYSSCFPTISTYLFMFEPSLSLSPQAPVFTALSEPAKSTKDILLTFSPLTPLSKSVNV